MTTSQHPIGSGFGYRSTAAEAQAITMSYERTRGMRAAGEHAEGAGRVMSVL